MIISISNQKGGIGKTTTSLALSENLSLRGYKVLAIDLDPQASLTFAVGADEDFETTIYEVLKGADINNAVQHIKTNLDVIAANIDLSAADMEFVKTGREFLLTKAINNLKTKYDYIILDTPPALNILTVNALSASNKVIIPMGADAFSIKGLGQLFNTIDVVREYSNPNLVIDGILLTKFTDRVVLKRDLQEDIGEIAEKFNTKVFKSTIRQSISTEESQANQESLFDYAPGSTTAIDYNAFVDEILGV